MFKVLIKIRNRNPIKVILLLANILWANILFSQNKKYIFEKIVGEESETAIAFLPFGTHIVTPDISEVWFIGYNYKSYGISVFKNTYQNWTFVLGYKRVWNFTQRFSITYDIGIMYGYQGKLQYVKGLPFRDTLLFKGPLNPVISFELDYKILKHISIHSIITPTLVIIYGLQYRFCI